MATVIERLEAAATGVRHARDIDIRVEEPEQAYPYLEILGANAGQLSLREASAWAAYLRSIKPEALLDLLKLARAASRLRIEEVADVGTVIVAWPDVRAALEPLLREVQP